MFAGHYAAALAAKAAEPRAPLWTYVAGCQLLDIGWAGLVAGGVEKVRVDPSLPGSDLDLYFMPWTHSLPAAIAWSVVAALVAGWALRLPRRAAVAIGLVVFSHWAADLLVHRPDLVLWPDGPKVGLALWNAPVVEELVEIGLLALAGMAWTAQRVREGRRAWPALAFMTFLLALQLAGIALPSGGGSAVSLGLTGLFVYLLATAVAWWLDRRPVSAAAGLRDAAARA